MPAINPNFSSYQLRMQRLGFYPVGLTIDDEWGPGMDSGMEQLLTIVERAKGISPDPARPPATVPGNYPTVPWGKIPKAYLWLREEPALPLMVVKALELYGTVETPGSADSAIIMGWAEEVGVDRIGWKYTDDAIPWCGLYMAVVAIRAGKQCPVGPLYALNWNAFGEETAQPSLGDVLTFKRDGGGHVALYIGEDDQFYYILGGNQGDAVNFTRIAKARNSRPGKARRPKYNVMPASVRPRRLSSTGTPISRNEA